MSVMFNMQIMNSKVTDLTKAIFDKNIGIPYKGFEQLIIVI